MAVIERDIVLQSMTPDGNKTIDMPITRLANVEGDTDILSGIAADDYLVFSDTSDSGQLKKVKPKALESTLTGINADISNLQADTLTFKNISVTTSSFTSNTDTDYPYKAQITCTGVTANHVPFVVFDKDSAATGIFAPYAETTAGKVIIYAVKPAACTIESIVCTRG